MRESTPLADISVDFQICVYCFWKAGMKGKDKLSTIFSAQENPVKLFPKMRINCMNCGISSEIVGLVNTLVH